MSVNLNGFKVDPCLAKLMLRADWSGKRTDPKWLNRFPAHPDYEHERLPFVEFASLSGLNGKTRQFACRGTPYCLERQTLPTRPVTLIRTQGT